MSPTVVFNSHFVQIALPIIITFIAAAWLNGKRIDDMKSHFDHRFDEVVKRLDRMDVRFDRLEATPGQHDQRITRVEERTSLLR